MTLKLVLSAFIITALLLELGQCQKKEDSSPKKLAVQKSKGKAKGRVSAGGEHKASASTAEAKPEPAQVQTFITQVLEKGKFQRVGDMLTVPAGHVLELRCKGKPVQWGVPQYVEEENDGRLRITHHERHGTLMLANSTGADTGEYTCYPMYCEDKDCRKEYDKAVRVFIFFSDLRELFVPSAHYYEVIQLRSNRATTLPCQVTSPLAQVTLHREFPPEEVKVDGTEISFDVKKGFTIYRPRPHHAGSLFCIASLRGLRQSSTKYMLIYVNYPVSPPSPVIKASSTSVHIGENLQVSCSVVGEADVVIDFTWEFPGQQIGRPLYTEDGVHPMRSGGQLRQQSESVLLVDEVRDVDQGKYSCTAQNLEGSRTVSTMVKVLPARGSAKLKKL
ncbi:platelet-derived growth factor receptor-like protein [Paramormyrops kingsleyae]|uniref:Platelet-derived growth factor receptor-like protein n=1 Tax=Paramormyrops kingsleyae TaxID=1676925 RepID=A0A3B3T7Z6_9TELE|nr:platelet-derived growth factor receptor-like protein [Paramormyrops kingsleyae]